MDPSLVQGMDNLKARTNVSSDGRLDSGFKGLNYTCEMVDSVCVSVLHLPN